MKNNWIVLMLFAGGLLVFGCAQKKEREPSETSNAAVEYVQGLQTGVNRAEIAAEKYERAAKARGDATASGLNDQ